MQKAPARAYANTAVAIANIRRIAKKHVKTCRSGAEKKFLKGRYQMSMTKYERAKVAEFYGQVAADILNSFLSAAEEKESSRPGVGAPKAADKTDTSVTAYRISHGAGNVKEDERK